MGLFQHRTPAPPSDGPLTRAEALAGIAVVAMYADGVLEEEEDADLLDLLATLEPFAGETERGMREIFVRIDHLLEAGGQEALLARCCADLPAEDRPVAFACAVDLLMADGEIERHEKSLVRRLETLLGLSDEEAARLIEVVATRQGA